MIGATMERGRGAARRGHGAPRKPWLALGLALAAWGGSVGCVRMAVLPTADPETTLVTSEPRPADELAVGLTRDPRQTYRVGPRDVLRVDVRKDPTLNQDYEVTDEGYIFIPNVGPVKVADLTTAEIETRLREVLSRFIIFDPNEPEIRVGVKEYRSKVIYVIGQVNNPGPKVMRADMMSLQEAIYAAGLPTNAAELSRVRVITPDPQNRPRVFQIDLADILYKGKMKENILLRPNDTVYVPARHSVNLSELVRELIDPVSQIFDLKYKMDFSNTNTGNN